VCPLGHRGSVPALTALSALTRIFKGGDAQTAPLLAGQVVQIAERLLSKLSQTQEICRVAEGWIIGHGKNRGSRVALMSLKGLSIKRNTHTQLILDLLGRFIR